MASPAVRAKISERTREALSDPEVRSRHRQRTVGDPEWRRRVSEGTRAGMADPAVRQTISERTKAGIAARDAKDLEKLAQSWEACSPRVRREFLEQVSRASRLGASEPSAP